MNINNRPYFSKKDLDAGLTACASGPGIPSPMWLLMEGFSKPVPVVSLKGDRLLVVSEMTIRDPAGPGVRCYAAMYRAEGGLPMKMAFLDKSKILEGLCLHEEYLDGVRFVIKEAYSRNSLSSKKVHDKGIDSTNIGKLAGELNLRWGSVSTLSSPSYLQWSYICHFLREPNPDLKGGARYEDLWNEMSSALLRTEGILCLPSVPKAMTPMGVSGVAALLPSSLSQAPGMMGGPPPPPPNPKLPNVVPLKPTPRQAPKVGTRQDPLWLYLTNYCNPLHVTQTPLLIEGDAGSSKTYTAREFGRQSIFSKYVECPCHADMETYDFIGGMIPGTAGFVWLDGPVARAFRLAGKGEKVFLLLDELRRVPRKQRSIFLTSLSPDKGNYRLMTGRPVPDPDTGINVMESIECPVSNLIIVGTTNVGIDFDVEEDDPAQADRFITVQQFTSQEMLRTILQQYIVERGFSSKTMEKLLSFHKVTTKMREDNSLSRTPNVRHLCRALQNCKDEASLDRELMSFIPTWCGRKSSGKLIEEQEEAIKSALRIAFK